MSQHSPEATPNNVIYVDFAAPDVEPVDVLNFDNPFEHDDSVVAPRGMYSPERTDHAVDTFALPSLKQRLAHFIVGEIS